MNRWRALELAVLVLLVLLVGLASLLVLGNQVNEASHPVDTGSIVDGYHVAHEENCAIDTTDLCGAAARLGQSLLGDPDARTITASGFAWAPVFWSDAQGYHDVTGRMGGLYQPGFALFTLASGGRRAVPMLCDPGVSELGRRSARPAVCVSAGSMLDSTYRVVTPSSSP